MTTETLSPQSTERSPRAEEIVGTRAQFYAHELAKEAMTSMPEPGVFIDPIYLRDHAQGQGVELKGFDEIVEWPVDTIVSAESFVSWEEGRGPGVKKGGKSSREVMEDYASRGTDLPPVDFGLRVYLTPSGRMVATTENTHRVGAAKLKGQKTIGVDAKTYGIVVKSLPDEDLDKALRWARGEW